MVTKFSRYVLLDGRVSLITIIKPIGSWKYVAFHKRASELVIMALAKELETH